MPQNGYSLGRDVTLNIVTAAGALAFSGISNFSSKQDVTAIKVKGLNGVMTPLNLPDGWSGSFEYDRKDGAIDDYFCDIEAGYFNGVDQFNVAIAETVEEPDGSVSQYRYTSVALSYDDAGAWAGDARTRQRINFVASKRMKAT